MQNKQLFDPNSSSYSYLIWDEETQEAALIDSVREQVERDSKLIQELGLKLRFLLETHIHADHVTGAGELRKRFKAKVAVHRNSQSTCADQLLEEGDSIGEEKQHNPRLAGKSRQEYIEIMENMDLPKPRHIAESVPGNLRCGIDKS